MMVAAALVLLFGAWGVLELGFYAGKRIGGRLGYLRGHDVGFEKGWNSADAGIEWREAWSSSGTSGDLY